MSEVQYIQPGQVKVGDYVGVERMTVKATVVRAAKNEIRVSFPSGFEQRFRWRPSQQKFTHQDRFSELALIVL